MFRRPRISRPKRSLLLAVTLTALLALPTGIVLAAHFNDVPNNHPFHADIAALTASGVTAGCGGGNYCPDANVTRDQMAAFMNRLGALGPGKVPVVNAATLQGHGPAAFGRVGIDVRANGTLGQWFNRGGGTPTVSHPSTGRYEITVPGKNFNVNNNFVGTVTLVSGPGFATVSSIGGQALLVNTYNASGTLADARFHVIAWDAVP